MIKQSTLTVRYTDTMIFVCLIYIHGLGYASFTHMNKKILRFVGIHKITADTLYKVPAVHHVNMDSKIL